MFAKSTGLGCAALGNARPDGPSGRPGRVARGSAPEPRRRWSEQDRHLLREVYPLVGTAAAAERLGRTRRSVAIEANRLGVRYEGPPRTGLRRTTVEQVARIPTLYALGLHGREIAEELGLGAKTVFYHMARLGLTPGRREAGIRARTGRASSLLHRRLVELKVRGATDDEVCRALGISQRRVDETRERLRLLRPVAAKAAPLPGVVELDVRAELARIRGIPDRPAAGGFG